MAIGSCVGQASARPAGTFTCENTPGKGPDAMVVEQTAAFAAPRTADKRAMVIDALGVYAIGIGGSFEERLDRFRAVERGLPGPSPP